MQKHLKNCWRYNIGLLLAEREKPLSDPNWEPVWTIGFDWTLPLGLKTKSSKVTVITAIPIACYSHGNINGYTLYFCQFLTLKQKIYCENLFS